MGDEKKDLSKLTEAEKTELRSMFTTYEEIHKEVQGIETNLKAAKEDQSAAVKSIHDKYGTGPFMRNGVRMKIVKRGDAFFFRGPGEQPKDGVEV